MGLIKQSQLNYYTGNDFGGYQFTSLEDIINQFLVAYVGEEKIINKVSRTDVAFHAQRAMQELSFDTFKSIKSQEIVLPPSNTMILPQDYVNYTRVLWSDESGIKHPLYPTKDTQNPFSIRQYDDGSYFKFGADVGERLANWDFSEPLSNNGNGWTTTTPANSHAWSGTSLNEAGTKNYFNYISDTMEISNGELSFGQLWNNGFGKVGGSRSYGAWQRIDVSLDVTLNLKASATSGARQYKDDGTTLLCDYGIVRVGITTTDPSVGWQGLGLTSEIMENVDHDNNPATPKTSVGTGNYYLVTGNHTSTYSTKYPSPHGHTDFMDLGYVEWVDGSSSEKELLDIDVSAHDEIWVWTTSTSPFTAEATTSVTDGGQGSLVGTPGADVYGVNSQGQSILLGTADPILPNSSLNAEGNNHTFQVNKIDQISVIIPGNIQVLSPTNADGNSSTWNKYKSATPSENQDSYDDNNYANNLGERYGLDPQHAQTNGSFYIDNLRGLINFSSNVSGKTVILDYISDSLGTDGEMQVHKFAEEAMYRWILHAVAAGRIQTQQLVPRLKKEKIAAIRQAKLRLSNIKLEELTQILRGKSKHIKH